MALATSGTSAVPSVMSDDVTQERAFAHANGVLKNAEGGSWL
jgi:hypothetical protein